MAAVKDPIVVPFFRIDATEDKNASREAGRPIFRDVEMVEVRIAGDRYFAPVFPALSMWSRVFGAEAEEFNVEDGTEVSYAERWPEQYRRFKEGNQQVAEGTPIDELPFLSTSRRAELKALKIYTVEALAAMDGKNLKVLGGDGYRFKEQAQAYLDSARGGAPASSLAAENADLRQRMEQMEEMMRRMVPLPTENVSFDHPDEKEPTPDYSALSDDELKNKIAEITGTRPRGNPNRDTLLDMLQNAA